MKARKNPLEWTVFAISALIFAALVLYLAYDALRRPSAPPQIEVTTGTIERQGDWWAVPVTITNHGEETAENARVEISLQQDDKDVEVAEVTVAFLPRRSRREAMALFRSDPDGRTVTARAIAFEKP